MPLEPISTEWLVELCCRACGARIEAKVSELEGRTALGCPDPACSGSAPLPSDLAATARYLFEESRRRLGDIAWETVTPRAAAQPSGGRS